MALLFAVATPAFVGAASSGAHADAENSDAARALEARAGILDPHLTVEPMYDGTALLTTDSLEWEDGLPDYTFALAEVATGRQIPLGYPTANSSDYSDLESDAHVPTKEPLVVGTLYEAYFSVETVGFWHCSIYDEDGCSWQDPETKTARWRFAYSGAKQEAELYEPPKLATRLKLSAKRPWHAHGWKVTVTLTGDGQRLAGQQIIGEYRAYGTWVRDAKFRTKQSGQIRVYFEGESHSTKYRFSYRGTSGATDAHSKSINIKSR